LERAERSQIVEFKCKEIAARDEEEQWSSKKAKERQQGKYHRGTTVKIGDANSCERCVSTGQDCLVYYLR